MSEQNIRIRLTGESDIDKLNQDLQNLEDQERDIRAEMLKTQAEYQKQVATIQANVKGREAQIAAIDKLQKKHTEYQRTLESEQKKVKTSMEQYNAALKNVNDTVAQGAASTPKLTTQIRLLKDELAKMEAAGVSPADAAFTKLAVEAARLEDQMGDTQQRVRILASDTKNLDAAMSIGQGLAGGFTVATSAAALLGGESEELQKAFFKVQAVMSILNGVNQVAIALNKDSAARVVISTALTNNETIAKVKNYAATKIQAANTAIEAAVTGKGVIAKGAATAAQWALNAAMYAFPLVAIIAALTALTVGIVKWAKHNNEAKATQEALTKSIADTQKQIERNKEVMDAEVGYMRAAGKEKDEIREYELKKLRDNLRIAQEENAKQVQEFNNASRSEQKKLKENLDASRKAVQDAAKAISDTKTRYRTEDIQEETNYNTKQTEDLKKKSEERIAQAKKEAEERKKLEIEMQNAVDSALNKQSDAYKKWAQSQQVAFKDLKTQEIQEEGAFVENWLTTLSRRKELGLINESDYLNQKLDYLIKSNASEEQISQARFEIEKQRRDEELEDFRKKEDQKREIIQASFDIANTLGNALFDAKKQQIEEEMELFNRSYTTDAEEAAKNKNMKLISEQEFQRKQLELKQKQAKADKQQALFNIAISTAQAVIAALASVPPNVPLSISAGVIGAIQAAAVAAKPLPRYAKGKAAGGAGHFATVGEQGAETMWIPDGAAVIPHGKPMDWRTFEQFNIPNIAGLGDKYIRGAEIDYNKLGRAVADNIKIPTPKPVTVNVDKTGISTFDGISTTKYLNKKYTGEW